MTAPTTEHDTHRIGGILGRKRPKSAYPKVQAMQSESPN